MWISPAPRAAHLRHMSFFPSAEIANWRTSDAKFSAGAPALSMAIERNAVFLSGAVSASRNHRRLPSVASAA